MACKDIVVNINDFNPLDTYTVTVRTLKSKLTTQTPAYTKVATESQVLFMGLPEGEYYATLVRTCASGGISKAVSKPVISAECSTPEGLNVNDITAIDADLDWTADGSVTFQLNQDDTGWFDGPATHYDAVGLVAGHVYEFWLRKQCRLYEQGLSAIVNFATTVAVPTLTVRVLDKVCKGDLFMGYRLRFNFTGGVAAVGDKYKIDFIDYYGTTHTFLERTVAGGESLDTVVRDIAGHFEVTKLIMDPTGNYAAFDIISREQKEANGVVVTCQNVDNNTGYSVSII